MPPEPGRARCVICRREVLFEDQAPKRCSVRDGGCGTVGGMSILQWPRKGTVTRENGTGTALPWSSVPLGMRSFEEQL